MADDSVRHMTDIVPNVHNVKVRTAGALKSGVAKSAELFKAEHGWAFTPSFIHGPHIEDELARGECDADIVGLIDEAIGQAVVRGACPSAESRSALRSAVTPNAQISPTWTCSSRRCVRPIH